MKSIYQCSDLKFCRRWIISVDFPEANLWVWFQFKWFINKVLPGEATWEQKKEWGKQDRKEKEAMQGGELRQSLPKATFILILQETMDCVFRLY